MAPASSPTALLLTESTVLSPVLLKEIIAYHPYISINALCIVTQAGLCGKLPLASSSVEFVLSIAETPGHHTALLLTELARLLRPGGSLVIQEPVGRRTVATEELAKLGERASLLKSQAVLEKSLLYAGFSAASSIAPLAEAGLSADWSGLTPASIGSTQGALLQPIAFKVQKPSWEKGTSFTLRKKVSVASTGAPAVNVGGTSIANGNGNRSTVKISLDEVDDVAIAPQSGVALPSAPQPSFWASANAEMDDLVDEDSLLTPEDLAPPAAVPADDCEVGRVGKKACKNCTCGRAEMEEKVIVKKLNVDQVDNPQSACGSCGLGDAFRCAGCPYRGLPAFKLGEKILFSGSLLAADI